MKKWLMLIFAAMVLSACSESEDAQEQGQENPADETEEAMNEVPEESGQDEGSERLESFRQVSSFDDLTKAEGGELTKDYSYKEEINNFAAINPLEGIEEEFVAGMGE